MLKIGLTGGIATGKSSVSGFLRSLGAAIIDADVLAREVVLPGKPAWQEIIKQFGPTVIHEDGSLNRKHLASIVFADEQARRKLNQITHPRVIERIYEIMSDMARQGVAAVVLDVPLLIEADMTEMVDEVWLVVAEQEQQRARLMARDGLTAKEATSRIKAQMPLSEKRRFADRVIDNTRTWAETQTQIAAAWAEITKAE